MKKPCVHYKDPRIANNNDPILCGTPLHRFNEHSNNPFEVTCEKCLAGLSLYFELEVNDRVINIDKHSMAEKMVGTVIKLNVDDYGVVVRYDFDPHTNLLYTPVEIQETFTKFCK